MRLTRSSFGILILAMLGGCQETQEDAKATALSNVLATIEIGRHILAS